MPTTHAIVQTTTRTLTTPIEDPHSINPSLGKRQARLNELGAEGWAVASTIVVGTTIIDTLQQPLTNAIPF